MTTEQLEKIYDKIDTYTLKSTLEQTRFNIFKEKKETLTTTSSHYQKQNDDPSATDYIPDNDPKNWPNNLYAENFSNHINPQSLYTNIEFRVGSKEITQADGSKATVDNWIALNSQNNNVYFKDLNIIDNGGVQKLTLNLYDKEFTNLETVVRGAVATAQLVMGQSGGMEKLTDKTQAQLEADEEIRKKAQEENSVLQQQIKLLEDLIEKKPNEMPTDENEARLLYQRALYDKLGIYNLTRKCLLQYGAMPQDSMADPTKQPNEMNTDDIKKSINFFKKSLTALHTFLNSTAFTRESINTTPLGGAIQEFKSNATWASRRNWSDPYGQTWTFAIPNALDNTSTEGNPIDTTNNIIDQWYAIFIQEMKKQGWSDGGSLDYRNALIKNNTQIILKIDTTETIVFDFDWYEQMAQDFKTMLQENFGRNNTEPINIKYSFAIDFSLNDYDSNINISSRLISMANIIKEFTKIYKDNNNNGRPVDAKVFNNELGNDIVSLRLLELSMYKELKKWSGANIDLGINKYYMLDEVAEGLEDNRAVFWQSLGAAALVTGTTWSIPAGIATFFVSNRRQPYNMEKIFAFYLDNNCIIPHTDEDEEKTPARYIIENMLGILDKVSLDKYKTPIKLIDSPPGYYDRTSWDNFKEFFNKSERSNVEPNLKYKDDKPECYFEGKDKLKKIIEERIKFIDDLFSLDFTALTEAANARRAEQQRITNEAISKISKSFEVMKVDTELQANLRISIGYTDRNEVFAGAKSGETAEERKSDEGTEANNWRKFYFGDDYGSYNARWWEVGNKVVDSNTVGESITFSDIVNARMQNCIRSPIFHYFITNVASKINNSGLFYTIEAFSLTSELINKYKIVQKYMNIVGEPEMMLSSLMTVFNERLKPTSSKVEQAQYNSGVYLAWGDAEYTIKDVPKVWQRKENASMQDSSAFTKSDITESSFEESDITNSSPIERYKMKIPLGGEESKTNPNIYRPLASMLNDFCAKFPMMVVYDDNNNEQKVQNISIDGEPINQNGQKIAPEGEVITRDSGDAGYSAQTLNTKIKKYQLTWACKQLGVTSKDTYESSEYNTNGIIIWFYYKKPKKYKFIRNYDWGKIDTSVVKNLDISNKSEFATISSITVFDRNTGGSGYNDANGSEQHLKALSIYGMEQTTPISIEKDKPLIVNRFAPAIPRDNQARYYNMVQEAYMHGVYEGKIQIVGDPGLFTNKNLCPYVWPIRINIFVPKYVQDTNTVGAGKETIGQIGTGLIPYREEFQLNYMSGIYVVTTIEHNISTSGYTTTLGVLRWPGIDDDVVGKNKQETMGTDFNKLFRSRQLQWLMLDPNENVDGKAIERSPTIVQIIHKQETAIQVNDMPEIIYISPAHLDFTQDKGVATVYLKITNEYNKEILNVNIKEEALSDEREKLNINKTYDDKTGIYTITFSKEILGAIKLIISKTGYLSAEAVYSVSPVNNPYPQLDKIYTTDDGKSGYIPPDAKGNAQSPYVYGPYTTPEELASVVWNELGSVFKNYNNGEKEITVAMTNSLINQNNLYRDNPVLDSGKTRYKSTAYKNRNGSGDIWNGILADVKTVVDRRGGVGGKIGTPDYANGFNTIDDGYIGNKTSFFNTGGTDITSFTRKFARYPSLMLAPITSAHSYIAGYSHNVELSKATVDVPYDKYITVVFTDDTAIEPYIQSRLETRVFKSQLLLTQNINGIDLTINAGDKAWNILYNKLYIAKTNAKDIPTSFKLMNTICNILNGLNNYTQ